MYACGRRINEAGDYRVKVNGTSDYFVFKIQKQNDGKEYNQSHDVVLRKTPESDDKYYMFRMGLECVTGVYVDKNELINPMDVCHAIQNVLVKTQTYFGSNTLPF